MLRLSKTQSRNEHQPQLLLQQHLDQIQGARQGSGRMAWLTLTKVQHYS